MDIKVVTSEIDERKMDAFVKYLAKRLDESKKKEKSKAQNE